jgi:hypothetical protein
MHPNKDICTHRTCNQRETPRRRCRYLRLHLERTFTWYQPKCKTETVENDPHQYVLVTWTQFKTLHKQQPPHIQSNTDTNQYLWTIVQLSGTASTSNEVILELFQSKALCMIVDASLNTTSWRRNMLQQLSMQCAPQCTSKWPCSEPHAATRQQTIAKTRAIFSV